MSCPVQLPEAAAVAAVVTSAVAATAVGSAAIAAASPDAPAALPAGHAVPSAARALCLTRTVEAFGPTQHPEACANQS